LGTLYFLGFNILWDSVTSRGGPDDTFQNASSANLAIFQNKQEENPHYFTPCLAPNRNEWKVMAENRSFLKILKSTVVVSDCKMQILVIRMILVICHCKMSNADFSHTSL